MQQEGSTSFSSQWLVHVPISCTDYDYVCFPFQCSAPFHQPSERLHLRSVSPQVLQQLKLRVYSGTE